MTEFDFVVIALKALVLALGGLITYFAYRAYRRTQLPALRALAAGFALITLGSFAGVVNPILAISLPAVPLVESLLTAIGFSVIVYSLYVE
jgi:hypothetical protein